MAIEMVEEAKISVLPKTLGRTGCIFYKNETCSPKKLKFKICLKCHRCQAITTENFVPQIYQRILGMAVLLMKTMGMPSGSAGSGGSGGAKH